MTESIREGILAKLPEELRASLSLAVVPSTGSTNIDLMHAALEGAPEGSVLLALTQTAGKGSHGRSFYSRLGTGLYMSILLRPSLDANAALLLTAAAAVAAREVCAALSGKDAAIKWVNDIYIGDRKVCGILTEGRPTQIGDRLTLSHAVVGLGINLTEPENGFPPELAPIAGALCKAGSEGEQASLLTDAAAAFLALFLPLYQQLEADPCPLFPQLLSAYRTHLYGLGATVTVAQGEEHFSGVIEGIDDAFSLLVKTDSGIRAVRHGQASVRPAAS